MTLTEPDEKIYDQGLPPPLLPPLVKPPRAGMPLVPLKAPLENPVGWNGPGLFAPPPPPFMA